MKYDFLRWVAFAAAGAAASAHAVSLSIDPFALRGPA